MDIGAPAPVAPPSMCPNVPVFPSAGTRRGQKYSSASNHTLPNFGEQLLNGHTDQGVATYTGVVPGGRFKPTTHFRQHSV